MFWQERPPTRWELFWKWFWADQHWEVIQWAIMYAVLLAVLIYRLWEKYL